MIKDIIFFFNNKNIKDNLNFFYSFLFGFIFVLCFPPFNFWPLLFPSLTFLFLRSYNSKSKKEAFFVGWFFGLSFFLFSSFWIFNSFLVRSGIFIYILPICLFLFSCLLALFFSLVTFLNYKFKTNFILSIIFFSIFWTFSEILRGHLFTGFPWNLLAHSFSNYDFLIQICSVFGVYGLSFFIIYSVVSLTLVFLNFKKEKNFFLLFSSLIIIFFISLFGINRLNNSDLTQHSSKIYRVVQPNINQKDKLNPSKFEENYKKLIELSFKNKMGALNISENLVIFWPETAIFDISHIKNYPIFEILNKNLKENEYLVTGIFKSEDEDTYFNSVAIVDKKLSVNYVYDKVHLVPFGEYIPFNDFFNILGINFFGLKKGSKNQKIIEYKNIPKFKALICYESIFPGKFINNKNSEVFLVNFTNDAWFGSTIGPFQHFANSKFRAVEEGKHLIRVANTGISASIDPYGRVLNKLFLNTSNYFDTKVFVIKDNKNNRIKTIYSDYKNNLIIILLIILFFLLSVLKYYFHKKI